MLWPNSKISSQQSSDISACKVRQQVNPNALIKPLKSINETPPGIKRRQKPYLKKNMLISRRARLIRALAAFHSPFY
jgi:hypothetical protein